MTEAREATKKVSQHLVRPAYWDICNGGSVFGTFIMFPFEMLHLFNLGIIKYLLSSLFNYVNIPCNISKWYHRHCLWSSGRQRTARWWHWFQ